MKCTKTMLYVAAAMAVAALLAYLAFPEAKLFILANTSILISLVCPISMLIMMWSMRGNKESADKTRAGSTTISSENQRPPQTAQISRENAS